jgi:hypothetical protein
MFRRQSRLGVVPIALLVAVVAIGISIPTFALGQGGVVSVSHKRGKKPIRNSHPDAAQDLALFKSHKAQLKGDRGPVGPPGPAGPAGSMGPGGPITGTLPSGVTLRGFFSIHSPSGAGEEATASISFGLQLPAAPTVHYIKSASPTPAGCSGTPSNPGAAAGNLCIFEIGSFNGEGFEFNPLDRTRNQATTFGGAVGVVSAAKGEFLTEGSWAVTG